MSPADLADFRRAVDLLAAVLRRLEGGTAAPPAPAAPAAVKAPKAKPCNRCGAGIVWGVFGTNGKPAGIEPDSLAGGFDLQPGKFGSVPHFEKTRGHRLHTCPNRGDA